MNTEGITRQDQRYRAPNLQEQGANHRLSTHCTTADKLVYLNVSLAGSVPSRKNVLDTFVHKRLDWTLVDQSPQQSENIRSLTSTNLHPRN